MSSNFIVQKGTIQKNSKNFLIHNYLVNFKLLNNKLYKNLYTYIKPLLIISVGLIERIKWN